MASVDIARTSPSILFLDREYSSYANPMEEDYVDKILAQHSGNFQGGLIIAFFNAVFGPAVFFLC